MKLGLVLAGPLDPPLPSTRVALLNILPLLHAQGFSSVVLHAPAQAQETPQLALRASDIRAQGVQTVIFQKVYGPSAVALAAELEAVGIRTVFLVCDRVVPHMAATTSATVCVTQHLASLYPARLAPRMHVVHDGIERPEVQKTRWRLDRGSVLRPLRAVLVTSSRLDELPVLGNPPPWLQVHVVGHYPERHDWTARARSAWRHWQQQPDRHGHQLRMAMNPRIRVHAWGPESVYQHLVNADMGIIPIQRQPPLDSVPAPAWSVKSENRLTLKMAVGLPVVATPIPAYEHAIGDAKSALLVQDRFDWLAALRSLRDPDARKQIGQSARTAVLEPFGIQRQAERLAGVLRRASS
jgi:hypothetical protein